MNYKYYICDVFTSERFGGNQLAVLTDARGLDTQQMQQIAREFNFSESTFVFPAEEGVTRKVRIFTPTREVPFAGHPNIGTAFVLASCGELGAIEELNRIVFEEKAGMVPITLTKSAAGALSGELRAPELFSLGKLLPVEMMADALSLCTSDIITETHPPRFASVGLPFLMVEVGSRSVLEKAKPNLDIFERISDQGVVPDVHVYVKSNDDFDIRTRMFAPIDGILEDPATGSANCALAGLLAHCDQSVSGDFAWRIAQGVEMGRPSLLSARAEKKNGKVLATWVGGTSVMVSEGTIYID